MRPRRPVHPGEMLLEEFLRTMGVSQRQFAAKLGWTTAKLNELVKGRRGRDRRYGPRLGQGPRDLSRDLDEPADDVGPPPGRGAPPGVMTVW